MDTIDEALAHMPVQLAELRMEEFGLLLKETIEAISLVSEGAVPFLLEEQLEDVLLKTTLLRQAVQAVASAYEQASIALLQSVVETTLIPAYATWRQQLERALMPPCVS